VAIRRIMAGERVVDPELALAALSEGTKSHRGGSLRGADGLAVRKPPATCSTLEHIKYINDAYWIASASRDTF
jgi:hypothetical protein